MTGVARVMTCVSATDDDAGGYVVFPGQEAVIECEPALRADVVRDAVVPLMVPVPIVTPPS